MNLLSPRYLALNAAVVTLLVSLALGETPASVTESSSW